MARSLLVAPAAEGVGLARRRTNPLGGPAGQRGRPVHPGIEGGCLGRILAQLVVTLIVRAGRPAARRAP